jgi:hypothetical protein
VANATHSGTREGYWDHRFNLRSLSDRLSSVSISSRRSAASRMAFSAVGLLAYLASNSLFYLPAEQGRGKRTLGNTEAGATVQLAPDVGEQARPPIPVLDEDEPQVAAVDLRQREVAELAERHADRPAAPFLTMRHTCPFLCGSITSKSAR